MMKKHLTLSAKVVIRDEEDRCLLLRRSTTSQGNPGRWDFPGGKVETGEGFDQSVTREVREETGLEISIVRVVGFAESESPERRIAYIILEGRRERGDVRLSEEHEEFLWAPVRSLSAMDLCPQFLEFAESYGRLQQPDKGDR
jgi:8-oxo-dGTP diphosphatase